MLLSSRFISVYGPIGSRTLNASSICKSIDERCGDERLHIDMVINSSGGSIDDAIEVLVYIDKLPAALSRRMRFLVYGIACSAAFLLFFCHPYSKWASAFAQFQLHDRELYLNEADANEALGRVRHIPRIEGIANGYYPAARIAAIDPSITIV